MPIRWEKPETITPFGEYVLSLMRERHLSRAAVSKRLKILPDHFSRILSSPHTSIKLPLLKGLAEILGVSRVELSLRLYDEGDIHHREKDARFIFLFDQFYRLSDADQDTLLGVAETLLRVNGPRPLSCEQEEDLASLRIAPTRVKRGGPRRGTKVSA